MVIALLITVGFSNCNSIRYSSYNRPFDFVKLQNNYWKSNVKPQQTDTLSKSTSDHVKVIEITTPLVTDCTVDNKVDPHGNKSDSSFNSISEPKHKPSLPLYRIEKYIQLDKSNVSEFKQENKNRTIGTTSNNDWNDFLLMLLLIFIALIAFSIIVAYLGSTPTGQIILAVIIIAIVVAGLVAAIAYNNTIIFDILELLLFFI